MKTTHSLQGSITALVTPFKKNGQVDYARFKSQIEYQIQNGTEGLVPCGTTGESPTLSHEEHDRVIEVAVETARGRVPVIAGTGSNSTDEAIRLTQYAKKVGADFTLNVVPYYNKPTQEGLYRHFEAIAKKTKLPMVLYNIPGRSGVGLTAETIERLSKIDVIVAIKEASGSMDMASDVLLRTRLTVLSGDDSLTVPLLSLGAKGVISVIANAYPADVARMVRSYLMGRAEEARSLHYRLFRLSRVMFIETNPIPIKTALRILGRDSGILRLPLCSMMEKNVELLQKEIAVYQEK